MPALPPHQLGPAPRTKSPPRRRSAKATSPRQSSVSAAGGTRYSAAPHVRPEKWRKVQYLTKYDHEAHQGSQHFSERELNSARWSGRYSRSPARSARRSSARRTSQGRSSPANLEETLDEELYEPAAEDQHSAALDVCLAEFPSAIRIPVLIEKSTSVLAEHGFTEANTELVYSSCSRSEDATLRDLEATWGTGVMLGGHAGIAFGGKAAWLEAAEAARQAGKKRVLVYLGTQATASDQVACPGLREWRHMDPDLNQYDVEQAVVSRLLHPHINKIRDDKRQGLELAYANFEVAVQYLRHVLSNLKWCEAIAFVGGINVDIEGSQPRFVPLILEAETTRTGEVEDYYKEAFVQSDKRALEWRAQHSLVDNLDCLEGKKISEHKWQGRAGVFFPITEEAKILRDVEPTGELLQCLKHFPTAQRNVVVNDRVAKVLQERGFTSENTLLAHATCPDEVNYDTEDDLVPLMHRQWGEKFTLGGLAGMPFCGQTGWGAFSAHTPKEGRILLLFAPHTGVNAEGEVGKLRRDGQDFDTTCCGAAIAAWKGGGGTREIRRFDTQQSTLSSLLTPYIDAINDYECPERGLVYANFDVVANYLRAIMKNPGYPACVEIAVIGGLMLNLPTPFEDRFVPLVFETMDCETGDVKDLFNDAFPHLTADPWRAVRGESAGGRLTRVLSSGSKPRPEKPEMHRRRSHVPDVASGWQARSGRFFPLLHMEQEAEPTAELQHCLSHFPNALHSLKIDAGVAAALEKRGWSKSNTVLVTSAAPEGDTLDIESSLVPVLSRRWQGHASCGGAAGFATGGVYAWKQALQKLNPGGNVLVVLATRTGVASNGEIGRVSIGEEECVACVHSTSAAAGGDADLEWDPEYAIVKARINKALEGKESRQGISLVEANYTAAREYLQGVIKAGGKGECGEIAILGGLTVALPEPFESRFVPFEFEVRTASGDVESLNGAIGSEAPTDFVQGAFFDSL
eukprot:Hpha_TRINITY_DN16135_c3_g2::TRINITY_DN16135_c3_g2_i1::g.8130::m.8130